MRYLKILWWVFVRSLPFIAGLVAAFILWRLGQWEIAVALLGSMVVIAAILALLYFYWRYHFFLRDPERSIPAGSNIVAPADGTVVYVKQITRGHIPISVKGQKQIPLRELTKIELANGFDSGYIIGIFMSMFDVHVNRAPISGAIEKASYFPARRNLDMERLAHNLLLKKRPLLPADPEYLVENERNTLLIDGEFPVGVVQIADEYVNKIVCWKGKGNYVEKGERIGMIRMGSQVDLVIPPLEGLNIVVKEGDHVKAGESILATFSTISPL